MVGGRPRWQAGKLIFIFEIASFWAFKLSKIVISTSFQTFTSNSPHVEWTYMFPKLSKNDGAKQYKVHVAAFRSYVVIDVVIAEAELDVNITS